MLLSESRTACGKLYSQILENIGINLDDKELFKKFGRALVLEISPDCDEA